MTNLLIALKNLIENPVTELVASYQGSNRANSMGDALEIYVKDLFCNSVDIRDVNQKNVIYGQNFSYIGNQNNPPDAIIRGGDAIEIKKIENLRSGIALNSSYPKDKLYSDSSMITQACRDCEDWSHKDLIYVIGVAQNGTLKTLWFVYGDCYAARRETYERIRERISEGIARLEGIELAQTNELGRINRVDPLGITYTRIRGMWGIENPAKVFEYIADNNYENELTVNVLMLNKKYISFPEIDRSNLESLIGDDLSLTDVRIKSPNNPAELLDAKLLRFIKQ